MRRSLALVVLALALAGCGDTDSPDASADGGMDHGMDGSSTAQMMDHRETSPVVDGARRIEVSATSFEFDPSEITVAAGEDVAIVLTSDDLLHDLTVEGLDVHVAAEKGTTEEGGLRADEPGRYTFYCTVEGHRANGMEGTLVVEAP
jgi:plastocyanin